MTTKEEELAQKHHHFDTTNYPPVGSDSLSLCLKYTLTDLGCSHHVWTQHSPEAVTNKKPLVYWFLNDFTLSWML